MAATTGAEWFLDTSYPVALASSTDEHHQRANELAAMIRRSPVRIVTTRAVLLEIGNSLARLRYRQFAMKLLVAIEQDLRVEIVPLSDAFYQRALHLYSSRQDKEWGLTDCASFLVMQDRGITEALTSDDHFRQAGFRPLLSEKS